MDHPAEDSLASKRTPNGYSGSDSNISLDKQLITAFQALSILIFIFVVVEAASIIIKAFHHPRIKKKNEKHESQ